MRIIAGSARGRKLIPPPDRGTRPALDRVRESIFAVLGNVIEDARVLDLFAGVGAFGLEAISRGARHATFVENSPRTLGVLRRNIDTLSFKRQSEVLASDALTTPAPGAVEQPYDVVFIDPPFPMYRDATDTERVLARVAELRESSLTTEDALVVLRAPSGYRDPLPFQRVEMREIGQSKIFFISPVDSAPL